VEIDFIDKYNKKLRFHFYNIIEYLETNANILMIIIDLYQRKEVVTEYPPDMDQICITGLVNIDENNRYQFSNKIYEQFIGKLFNNYRAGDYCLFHSENLELWTKAKHIYRTLHERNIKRQFTRMLTNKRPASSHIAHQIIKRLELNKTINALCDEIGEILTLMYDISEWSFYTFDPSSKEKLNFKILPHLSENGKRIQETESVKKFIHQVLKEKKQLIDWTGTYQGIPISIGSGFNILFVYKLIADEVGWGRVIPTFIKEAMTLYYNKTEKDKMSSQIQYLKDSIPEITQSKSIYRKGEQSYWAASRYFLFSIGIKEFTLHEILDDDSLRSSHSKEEHLTPYEDIIRIDKRDYLKKFRDQFKKNPKGEIICDLKDNKQLTGCNMRMSGNMMIIETHFTMEVFEKIQEPLYKYFNLIYLVLEQNIVLYQTYRQLNATKEILEQSQDYIFITSHERDIIFVNKILSNALHIENNDMNQLKEKFKNYPSEHIDTAFQKKELIYRELSFEISNKPITTFTTVLPLQQDNNVFAVAVIMQENTYRHELIETSNKLINTQSIDILKREILSYFNRLGFQYVIPYRRPNKSTNEFISEDGKDIIYKLDDEDTHSGKISLWHRKGYADQEVLDRWAIRLQTTPYKLKADENRPEGKKQKLNQDNFWITVPILYDDKVIKVYCMGWHDDSQWRNESIYVANLRLIEAFARSVGQTWENISQKIYQTKFQNMISHGIIEPLQLMRSYLEQAIDLEDKPLREQKFRTADANLEMAQSALLSILSTYVGQTRVKKEYVHINEHLLNLLAFFKAYATERAKIEFITSIPDEPLICHTDPIMMNQIFNNLVGNSIRQLKKTKRQDPIERIISIQVKKCEHYLAFNISDNGPGLSEEVKNYFYEKTFITKGMVPTGRLGIGFSKEISEMLGGKLELIEPPALGKGTSFLLSLPFNEE